MNRECEALAGYLVGRQCPPDVAQRYLAAVRDLGLDPTPFEGRLWRACLRARPLLSCLDAGVALCHKDGAVRKRLLVMFALLETAPETADRFLFVRATPLRVARMFARAVVAPLALVGGIPLGLACRVASRRTRS